MNYYAVQKVLDVIEKNDNPPDEDKFSSFLEHVQNNENLREFQSTIIPKLRDLYDMNNKNLIEELYRGLTTNNKLINEDVLHLIVTSMLNMDTKSEKYNAYIQNAHFAIKLLKIFIKFHRKIKARATNAYDYNEVEDKQETYGSTIIFYDKIAKTEYSTKEFQIKNCFIAYKWLMALYGIINHHDINTFEDININIKELMKYEKNIIKTEKFKEDQHYMFLQVKEKSNNFLNLGDWENSNRPGDWSLEEPTYTCLSFMNKNSVSKLIVQLKSYSTWRYVNKIEFFIIRYRYHKKYTNDYKAMYASLIDAVSEPVITPEDRLRNLEAHELFSMFLMERNNEAINDAKNIGVSKAYYKFMRDPRIFVTLPIYNANNLII
ncbi:uncharacterized protein LOC112593949 [Melanaphis sacchari]|uniref:uncharacterized protein LOC112593949 n=1 Tax=Melanaphis sacchari TaxID=742174 RepID=UPI000DC14327|nr:uncharacterized protein LOC112593949 [Melanaphis sacchari]